MTTAPTEPGRRRPTWRAGTPVTLADGAAWTLAATTIDHTALVGPGGAFVWPQVELPGQPPGFEPMPQAIEAAMRTAADLDGREDAAAFAEFYDAMLTVALPRLLANYDLADVEAVALLRPSPAMLARDPEAAGRVMLGVVEAVTEDFAKLNRACVRAAPTPDPGAN